jgi:adenylate cyclase
VKSYFIKVSAATIVLFLLLYGAMGLFLLRQQENSLYREAIDARRFSLNHLVNNAVMPLLDDDALSLNALLKEARTVDGVVYGMVVDQKGVVRAHSDVSKLGSPYAAPENISKRSQEGETLYTTYGPGSGPEILDISTPVKFMKRELGWVHLGVSTAFIQNRLGTQRAELLRALLLWGLAILVALAAGAVLLGLKPGGWEVMGLQRQRKQDLQEPLREGVFPQVGEDNPLDGAKDPEADQTENQTQDLSRNQVVVLFAGIKGFKRYAQTREPAKLMEDLNGYVSIATECVLRYGGYIDKFIGDAVIAVFTNSPLEASHAERAINAALDMQNAFRNGEGNENQLLSQVGIGISSGIVLSGTFGPDAKKEPTFFGESFKVAYSLTVMAKPGEIIISRDAYQLLKDRISVEPLPPMELMQRTQPWQSFRYVDRK